MLTFRVSSSISNFYDKIKRRFSLEDWYFLKSRDSTCVFFGLYHIGDYVRFLWHRGRRIVFWCGSDILNLQRSKFWSRIIPRVEATHWCENVVEAGTLYKLGILGVGMQPMFFGNIDEFPISYKQSDKPKVWVTFHPGREEEYGVNLVKTLARSVPEVEFYAFDGRIPEKEFNEKIKGFQAHLRLNEFDGFGDSLAKSVLMGQHPISRIPYRFVDYAPDMESLVRLLKNLKNKKSPNFAARNFYLHEFTRQFP